MSASKRTHRMPHGRTLATSTPGSYTLTSERCAFCPLATATGSSSSIESPYSSTTSVHVEISICTGE
jgi:hypothetical protein